MPMRQEDSLGEACELAEQALAFHVEGLIYDGEPVPDPTSLEKVISDADGREIATVMVPLRTR